MEGNVISSDIFAQSRLTMINVWATYCNPCLREMPDLGALHQEFSEQGFQILRSCRMNMMPRTSS